MVRCRVIVFDIIKRRNRTCLNKTKCTTGLCTLHSTRKAICIQAAWRRYITRKRVNLFKQLPCDIWGIILNKMVNNISLNIIGSHIGMYEKRIKKCQIARANAWFPNDDNDPGYHCGIALAESDKIQYYKRNIEYCRSLI